MHRTIPRAGLAAAATAALALASAPAAQAIPAANGLPPTATSATATVAENVPVAITLAATDPENGPLTYALRSQPGHGTISGTGQTVTYTPGRDYTGADSFTFVANDGGSDSNVATITLDVKAGDRSPVATAATVVLKQDSTASIPLAGTDPDNDALTPAIVHGPAHGTLTGTGATRTYTPAAGYTGSDSVDFTVSDGKVTSAVATVAITVQVNHAPVAEGYTTRTTEGTPVKVPLFGSDAEGDKLTFIVGPNAPTYVASHGKVTGTAPDLVYTPDAGFTGRDGFSFAVSDGVLTSSPSVVNIDVAAVGSPPAAYGQTVRTRRNNPVAIRLHGAGTAGGALRYAITGQPRHGFVVRHGSHVLYVPRSRFVGTDTFRFTVKDSAGRTSGQATVTVKVRR